MTSDRPKDGLYAEDIEGIMLEYFHSLKEGQEEYFFLMGNSGRKVFFVRRMEEHKDESTTHV